MHVKQKLNHTWRWLSTAFLFAVFGLGGILISLILVPCLRLMPGDTETQQKRARRIIQQLFRCYINLMRCVGVLDYQVTNLDKLQGAKLVLANHPSLIDVIFLIALLPNANCVVKGALTRNFFTRGPVLAAGYIINDESNDVIDEARQAFARGDTLIVFPEGTRTTPNQPLKLKRGAANIAVRADADITPVLIQCNPTTLTKADPWYKVPDRKINIGIEIKDLISIAPYTQAHCDPISARQLTQDLSTYFNKELSVYERPTP